MLPTTRFLGTGQAVLVAVTVLLFVFGGWTGARAQAPTISGGTLASDNAYVEVSFSEGVYTNSDGTGALTTGDLSLSFTQNGGSATDVTIDGLTTTGGNPLSGGEDVVRVQISVTDGPASGDEEIEIQPTDGSSIYDADENAMDSGETTGLLTLNDQRAPTISNVTLGNDGSDNLAFSFDSDEPLGTGTADLAVTVDGPSGTDAYTFDRDDFVESGSGPYTYTLDVSQAYGDDGTYTAAVDAALDSAGNDGATGESDSYTLDTTAPTISTNSGLTLDEGTEAIIPQSSLEATDAVSGPTDLVYTIDTAPVNGQVLLNGSQTSTFTQADINNDNVSYSHDDSETTADSFDFTVTDGSGRSTSGSFSIAVNATNDAPALTTNSGLTLDEDTEATITTTELDANDVDDTDENVIYSIGSGPSNGVLEVNGSTASSFTQQDIVDGVVAYVPNADYNGSDSFTFTLTDDDGATGASGETFSLTVDAVNDAPTIATNSGLTLDEGTEAAISSSELETTDVEDEPSNLVYTIDTAPANGQILLNGSSTTSFTQADINSGTVSYQHDDSETTADSFDFTVADQGGSGKSASGTFSITINAVNESPTIATNNGLALDEGGAAPITSGDLETTDAESGPSSLTYSVDTAPANGQVLLNGSQASTFTQAEINSGNVSYSHDGSETSSDSFEFTVSDEDGASVSGSFSVSVNPVNDSPAITTNSGLSLDEDSAATITSGDLETTDAESGPSSLEYTVGTLPSNGTIRLDGSAVSTFTQADINSGTVAYEHDGSETTADSFDFTVSDEGGKSASGTFSITINPVNDAPTLAGDQAFSVAEGGTYTLTDSDLDGEDPDDGPSDLTYSVATAPSNGQILVNGSQASRFTQAEVNSGTVAYQHDDSETTSDGFELTLSDGEATTAPTGVSVSITAQNESPTIATNTGLTLDEDAEATITSSELETTDVESGPSGLTYSVDAGPSNGTLLLDGSEATSFTQADINSGTVAYRHDGSETTADSFDFIVSDEGGTSASGTFSITVNPVNDPPTIAGDQAFSVAEGGTYTLTDSDLDGEDPDDDPSDLTYSVTTAPSNGQILVNGSQASSFTQAEVNSGTVAYQHDDSETTSDGFELTLSDGEATSASASVSVSVTAQNDDPTIATNSELSLEEGTTATIGQNLLETTDPESGPSGLTYSVDAGPSNGTILLNGSEATSFTQAEINSGNVAYRHDGSETSADSFDFTVSDESGGSASGTFSISISAVNEAPTISLSSSSATIDEDTDLSPVGFTIDDAESDPSALTVSATSDAPTLVPDDSLFLDGNDGTRSFSASPATDANGSATITLTVSDDEKSDSATFSLTVDAVNDAPSLVKNDGLTLDEDTEAAITPTELDATDIDDADENVVYTVGSGPSNGTLEVNGSAASSFTQQDLADEVVAYVPNTNYNGSDSFTFTLTDDDGATGVSGETFSVTVNAVNDPPTVSSIPDQTIDEDSTLSAVGFTVGDVETSPSDLMVTASSDTPALVPDDSLSVGGSGADRTVAAVPSPDSNGTATITVTASDGGESGSSAFTLTVDPVNDPPVLATNRDLPVQQGGQQTITTTDLNASDIDDADAELEYIVDTPPANGSIERVLSGGGTETLTAGDRFTQREIMDQVIRYNHTSSSLDDDSFTFSLTDGSAGPTGLTFQIIVTGENSPPTARNDTFSVQEDQTLQVTQAENGVLANDDDPEGGVLKASIVSTPSNGSLSLNNDGTFTYDPTDNFNGTDEFVYEARDRNGGTDEATVRLNVTPVNDPPQIATNAGVTAEVGGTVTITPSQLDATDVDDGPSALTYEVTTSPSQGQLLVDGTEAQTFTQQALADGQVEYAHSGEALTDDQFTFRLTDDEGAGPTGRTFIITVPPAASDDRYVAVQGETLEITRPQDGVLANDGDPEGDDLQASVVTPPSNGTVTLDPVGTFTYTPNGGFQGEDTFEYEVSDESGTTDQAVVTIRIRPSQAGVAVERSFSSPTQQRSFRLVALPGGDGPPLASTLSAQRGDDWRAFRETGATDTSSYGRAQCGAGTECALGAGTGYWLIARDAWSIEDSVETVALRRESAASMPVYPIPLQDGWNVVSNPLETDVAWSAVQAASGTDQALWRWDGSWNEASTFASAAEGEAYYFRDDQLDTLDVPYPSSPSPQSQAKTRAGGPTLALHAVQDGDTLSTARAGRRAGAAVGLDSTDRYGPPGYFGGASLRFLADGPDRRHALRADYKPPGSDGRAFDLRLRAAPDTVLTLAARGAAAFADEQVVLVNRAQGRSHDLRADSSVVLAPQSRTTRFRLLIGSAAFVDDAQEALAPDETKLMPNYPNPFRRATTIEYALEERQEVRLAIYDVLGRRVQVLADGPKRAGFHRLQWQGEGRDGRPVASGVYFARLVAGSTTQTERLVVVR